MGNDLIATASTTIAAAPPAVWKALVDPAAIKQYMFGTSVTSDFKEGSPISWRGEWEGKKYEDKGKILRIVPNKTLSYSHYSPLAGLPDKPENYHTVTIELTPKGNETAVKLSQNNNPTEKERQHSEKNWSMMLEGLKKYVEQKR